MILHTQILAFGRIFNPQNLFQTCSILDLLEEEASLFIYLFFEKTSDHIININHHKTTYICSEFTNSLNLTNKENAITKA